MIKIFNQYISQALPLLLVEVIILVCSLYLGAIIRFDGNSDLSSLTLGNLFLPACVFALMMELTLRAFGMSQYHLREDFRKSVFRPMPSLALGFGIKWWILIHHFQRKI
jgi:hypothetical protein